jgi:hypothetical protein
VCIAVRFLRSILRYNNNNNNNNIFRQSGPRDSKLGQLDPIPATGRGLQRKQTHIRAPERRDLVSRPPTTIDRAHRSVVHTTRVWRIGSGGTHPPTISRLSITTVSAVCCKLSLYTLKLINNVIQRLVIAREREREENDAAECA